MIKNELLKKTNEKSNLNSINLNTPENPQQTVIAFLASQLIESFNKDMTVSLTNGFSVPIKNRAGFAIFTPFGGSYSKVWIKTGFEILDEIKKMGEINENKYPGVTNLFTMPLFIDPKAQSQEGKFICYPFVAGKELEYVRSSLTDMEQIQIEDEIISKIQALHSIGLFLSDTNVTLGSNIIITDNTAKTQLPQKQRTAFIDFASLEEGFTLSKERLDLQQVKVELEFVLSSYIFQDPQKPFADSNLTQKSMRLLSFLNKLLDSESKHHFLASEFLGTIQLPGFLSVSQTSTILARFKQGFTIDTLRKIHQDIYNQNQLEQQKLDY